MDWSDEIEGIRYTLNRSGIPPTDNAIMTQFRWEYPRKTAEIIDRLRELVAAGDIYALPTDSRILRQLREPPEGE